MSEEEQAAQEAEEAEAKADATDEEPAEGKAKAEPDEESKQLEVELSRERAARKKAEEASADYAFKLREKKRKESKEGWEEPDDEEDTPLTKKGLQTLLAEERETVRKEAVASEAERLVSNVSTNDTERQLILEIHKNRSFPAHLSLAEQIEECYVIANKKKILGENSELKRALKGKSGVSHDASGSHQDAPTGSQPKLAKGDSAELARVGFKWNGSARRFEKKLANGGILVRETNGKTRLIKT